MKNSIMNNNLKKLLSLPLLLASWGCMESAPQTNVATTTDTTTEEPATPIAFIVQESPVTPTRSQVEGFDFATIGSIAIEMSVIDPRGNRLADANVSVKGEDGTLLMRTRTDSNGQLQTQVSYRLADANLTVEVSKPFYAPQINEVRPLDLASEAFEVMLPLDNQGDDEADLPPLD